MGKFKELAMSRSEQIRTINDRCRKHFLGCTLLLTPCVQELDDLQRTALLQAVRDFNQFDADNDPHHEHDFGSILFDGRTWFFKFDYYDESLRVGSEDPSNVEKTRRVLTVMAASEY